MDLMAQKATVIEAIEAAKRQLRSYDVGTPDHVRQRRIVERLRSILAAQQEPAHG